MELIVVNSKIPDVKIIEPVIHSDDRGYFCELYRSDTSQLGFDEPFVQENQSRSKYGVVRGLHLQIGSSRQAKLIRVIEGSIFDVAVDVRPWSPTLGQYVSIELSASNLKQLFVPTGFAHGFVSTSEFSTVQYLCSNYYSRKDELQIRWDDRDIGIDWPLTGDVKVSPKDELAQSFKSFCAQNYEV